jgi:hypothetical protein
MLPPVESREEPWSTLAHRSLPSPRLRQADLRKKKKRKRTRPHRRRKKEAKHYVKAVADLVGSLAAQVDEARALLGALRR